MRTLVFAAIAWAVGATAVFSQVSPTSDRTGEPLRIDAVLASSAEHFPAILKSLADRDAAAGRLVEANGAFDLVFSADGFDRVNGFWTGRVVNTEVRQNLRAFGASVYGGYRVSDGTFPIYEDINFTNTGGEAKVGVLFSLLRDRAIDDRRFRITDARLALQQAEFEVLLTKIGVQRRAIIAYWRWVAAGRQLAVYERLLSIAKQREAGLEEQVRQGARARIFLTENQQNITRRQRLVIEAKRNFDIAANELSFYYRGADSAPIIPSSDQLPNVQLAAADSDAKRSVTTSLNEALQNRPELSILQNALRRAEAKVAVSRNELKPRLDLNAELSRDFGEIAEGGISRDSTDAIVGFRFSVPFQRREAKGRVTTAQAATEATRQERRQTAERIELEVRNILIDRDMANQLARIAELEVTQSETMEQAERERFASGASDFFVVNIREETTADARIRNILAELQTRVAEANLSAATVNASSLGLSDHHLIR
ncbi:MAG: TolC family protein [Pseudomonadota bacterium]